VGTVQIVTRKELGTQEWNELCDCTPNAWFFHRAEWIDYQIARGAADASFVMGDPVNIVCPLVIAERHAAFEGHPGPAAFAISCVVSKQEFRDVLDSIARDELLRYIGFRSHPFSRTEKLDALAPGWTKREWLTNVVDLTQPVETLHAGLRKSYTSLINHVNGSHEITVDWQGDLIESFRQLHAADAGRETRPQATWEMQRQWCRDGHGLIVGASLGGVLVAATYWIIYKRCAYYASSASLHKNVTHSLIWRTMLELKKAGVEQLEMGWLDYDKSEKGQGIAKFKQGFGGEARTIYAVERTW
jgi:hypothetical protein